MHVPAEQDPRTSGLAYEPFYGLREKPFSLTSDSRYFYQSRSHALAFDDLLNAIHRRESLNVLTGDIGTGKTTLCRAVLQSLDRKAFSAFVADPFASREDLLKILLMDFGVVSVDDVTSGRLRGATRTELSYLLYEFLATLAPLQAYAVVFIDEAQNLSVPLLEETRILSDADGKLQVVLVGQLELRDKLQLPEMRQLDQRVSVYCQLLPLDREDVAGYIAYRLQQAGGSADRVKFSEDAVDAIDERSSGVPRIINRLCDRALREGHARRAAVIDRAIVESANPSARARAAAALAPPPAVVVPPPAAVVPAPAPSMEPAAPPLPEHLETWLSNVEAEPRRPEATDWRQRWTPGHAPVAAALARGPDAGSATSVGPRRLMALAALLIAIVGAVLFGPAAIGASVDLLSAIGDGFTPPEAPATPARPQLPQSPPLRALAAPIDQPG